MVIASLVAFAHFAAAFGLAAAVFYEWFAFERTPSHGQAVRLARADMLYGVLAGALLAVGFVRAIWFEKGWAYYTANPFFHLKLSLFLAVGLLSVYPTLRMLHWRPALKAGLAPHIGEREFRLIRACLRLEVLGLVAIVLCASLMAHGVTGH